MSNLIYEQTYRSYALHIANFNKGKVSYLYANDGKHCLEVHPLKKHSLEKVFQKSQEYLKERMEVAKTGFEVKKQIRYLYQLSEDSKKRIQHYHQKNNTLYRRLLKLIYTYIPKIFKNYFPHIFTNQI